MKKLNILIALILVGISTVSFSQQADNWMWLNPKPQGNTLYAMDFVNDNTGFAAGDYGTILKTSDNGISWTKLNTQVSIQFMSIDFVNEDIGYAGGFEQMMKKTTNGGFSWSDVVLPREGQFDSLFSIMDIQFINENTGYVLGFFIMESKIWKTTNGGLNWTTQTTDGGNYLNNLYFIDENNGFASGGSLGGEVIKTTNGGTTWNLVYEDIYQKMSMIFLNATTGFTGCEQGRVYKTTDAGDTWNFAWSDAGLDITSLNFIDANTGFGFGSGSVYVKTTNGGDNWYQADSSIGSSPSSQYLDAVITPNGTIHAAGTFGAMVRSTNNGNDFTYDLSVTDGYVSDIEFLNSTTGYAVTGYNHGDILKTTDAGVTWVSQVNAYTLSIYGISFTNEETGYLAGSLTVYKTNNGGTNWQQVYVSTTNEIFTDVYFTDANTGYVIGSYGKLLKTVNAGVNWTSTTISSSGTILSSIFFVNGNTGYAVGDNNAAVKTTDAGVSWSTMSVASPFINLSEVFFSNENTGYISSADGIYKTTTGGNTWFKLLTPNGGYAGVQFRGNFGYAIGGGGRIIKTTDAGNSWIVQPTVTDNGLYALYFNTDNYVYAGGLLGTIIKTIPAELIVTGIGNSSAELPEKFTLSQNYPNPFNPVTNLEFGISNPGFVSLKVYNIIGKEVATLVNENLRPGTYKYSFDAAELSSGVYFYTLSTQGFTETKRMILLK